MKKTLLALLLLLAGCATHADLDYRPTAAAYPVMGGVPQIAGIVTVDQRKESARQLGTSFNGYGMPVGLLDTSAPVKDEVARVFWQALAARGEITRDPRAPLVLQITLYKFDSDRVFRKQANVDLSIALVDRRTNRIIYQDRATDRQVKFDLMHAAFDTDDLEMMCEQVLSRAVDHLIDKPGFAALAHGVPPQAILPPG